MMEKNAPPYRLVFVVVMSIIVFSLLIWLSLHNLQGVLQWLATIGVCFGVGWLVILAGAIYGIVVDWKDRRYQAKEPERLKQHQARFYCHICGKPSPQPDHYWEEYGENGKLYSSFMVLDYNKPTELVQCAKCQQWTCPNADPPHLENGVCKICLENIPHS